MPRVMIMKTSTVLGNRVEKGLLHVGSMITKNNNTDGIDLFEFKRRIGTTQLPGILSPGHRVGWYKSRRA